jgi:hypothetical protein
MKTTTYFYSFVCGMFLMGAGLTSCNSVLDDDYDSPAKYMQINTTRVDSNVTSKAEGDIPGRVLFWTANNFGSSFYTTADIDNLNAWETTKYNTGKEYPEDGSTVYAAGYSPITNVTPAANYQKLTISDANSGQIDVCTSNAAILGSSSSIFKDVLTFDHTLTKVVFIAKRDKTMEGNRSVNSVYVTIPKEYLATEWDWDATNMKYAINTGVHSASTLSLSDYDGDLTNIDTNYSVGTCYLMLPSDNGGLLGNSTINIQLTAKLLKTGESSTSAVTKTWNFVEGIQLYEQDGTTKVTKANAGDSYVVIFNFTNDTFTFEAHKMPWQNGGLITIPINTNK